MTSSKPAAPPEIRRGRGNGSHEDPLTKWVGKRVFVATRNGNFSGVLLYVTTYTIAVKGMAPGRSPYEETQGEQENIIFKNAIGYVREEVTG